MLYLFERIAHASRDVQWEDTKQNMRELIKNQIQRIVSSHMYRGRSGLSLVGFDVSPITGQGYASSTDVAEYCSKIQNLIEIHEPRLVNVRVSIQGAKNPLMPFQAEIMAKLREDLSSFSIKLDMAIMPS
jgi:predicted component of type VI protein secretion system